MNFISQISFKWGFIVCVWLIIAWYFLSENTCFMDQFRTKYGQIWILTFKLNNKNVLSVESNEENVYGIFGPKNYGRLHKQNTLF